MFIDIWNLIPAIVFILFFTEASATTAAPPNTSGKFTPMVCYIHGKFLVAMNIIDPI